MKDLTKIRLFAMDVDGTLTDGKIYISDAGEAMKAFSPKDGLGIKLLLRHHIIPVIITGRTSKIVENRCKEIGIQEIHQGIRSKADTLQMLMDKYGLEKEQTAYIGDDVNDLSAMRAAGVSFAPADCARQLLSHVDVILTKKAGDSPVREAIDQILTERLSEDDYIGI